MAIFLIVLDTPDEKAWEAIKNFWPDPASHMLDERVAFVVENKLLTSQISEIIGICSDMGGLVVQMDFYAGNTSLVLVEWLAKIK